MGTTAVKTSSGPVRPDSEMEYFIKENSFIARLAALRLRAGRVAVVIGKTVHLHNTTTKEFRDNVRWVRHEAVHLEQFRHFGFFTFIFMYLWESLKNGYWNNKYEVEARDAERRDSQ